MAFEFLYIIQIVKRIGSNPLKYFNAQHFFISILINWLHTITAGLVNKSLVCSYWASRQVHLAQILIFYDI